MVTFMFGFVVGHLIALVMAFIIYSNYKNKL